MQQRKNPRRRRTPAEFIMENLFQLCALVSIAAVATITVYLFVSGVPAMFKIGFREFLLGTVWRPTEGQFGILPMILTSIVSTLLAVAIGSVIGVMTAICMVEIAPAWLTKILRPCIELLAGIPSVVYGYFGLMLIVPLIAKVSGFAGNSLLAVIIILSMMILPTIINISETALRAVPREYKEGSLALGASGIQTIFKVLLPAARSGVLSAIVLGIGRAIGETMAVILVAGNTPRIPTALFDSVRTLTINIAFEMSYAQGLHKEALFATGVVLFVFIMALNIVLNVLLRRKGAPA